jgi:hypothetical protein
VSLRDRLQQVALGRKVGGRGVRSSMSAALMLHVVVPEPATVIVLRPIAL